jgi:hypothetical protein
MSLNLEDILNKVKQVEETKVNQEKSAGKDARVLTFRKGSTYTLRLIPNINDVDNTFVSWKEIGFPSVVNGAYVYGGRSPQDAGIKDDPFKTTQWSTYSKAKEQGDEEGKKRSYKLIPSRKQVGNAYLVSVEGDDNESKAKVGSIVVVKYPAQVDKDGTPMSDIYKKIHSAIFGDMAKKIGTKALDLSEKGKSLIIKVTDKAGFNNYDTMFDDSESLGLTPAKIEEVLKSAHDLTEFVPEVKSTDEIRKILDTHWFGNSATSDDDLDEDEIPHLSPTSKTSASSDEVDELDELLKE